MTQAERDAALGALKRRLQDAQEEQAAAFARLMRWRELCHTMHETIDGCLRDQAMRIARHDVAADWPTGDQLRVAFDEVRRTTAAIAEGQTLLRQAGFQ